MLRRQLTLDSDETEEEKSNKCFFEMLHKRVEETNSLLCVGLDPHIGQLESANVEAAIRFCTNIISQTHPFAAAFKPNSAFFETFGPEGIAGLIQVIQAIPNGIPVILDAKRGDIESTAQAYADSAFSTIGAHAITLSPYMGWDSIFPFVTGKYSQKAAFLLCKTSNPSSKELQELKLSSGTFLFEEVAKLTNSWEEKAVVARNTEVSNGSEEQDWGCIGLVAGATDIPSLRRVRQLAPQAWILCPGVGAQGGNAETVCDAGLRSDGSGLLVSVSRGISAASDMAGAAQTLRDIINDCREKKVRQLEVQLGSSADDGDVVLTVLQTDFLQQAKQCGALQFGNFTLKSGRQSPYFFNAGLLCSGKSFLALGRAYAQAVHKAGLEFDVVFGPAYKGIPLATALSMAWSELFGVDKEVAYNRKEAKDHGEGGLLVGASVKGRRVLIVDDVITAGTAIRESLQILGDAGGILAGVVVALDRQEWSTSVENGSAVQQVQRDQGVPVMAIVELRHLISFVAKMDSSTLDAGNLSRLREYRKTYGVEY